MTESKSLGSEVLSQVTLKSLEETYGTLAGESYFVVNKGSYLASRSC